MKLPTLSTLWDYIHRAMPWNAPKSLRADEVYAVTAYMLNLGGVVPDDFVLSDATSREVQQRLPNRNGMTTRARAVARRAARRRARRAGHALHARLRGRAAGRLDRCPTSRATRTATWPSRTALVGAAARRRAPRAPPAPSRQRPNAPIALRC